MKIQVSELIVKYLEKPGIEFIFCMPGAHILPVYDSLYHSSINSVLVKHEQCASFMASGCARASAKISACITTAGPGATNLVTGVRSLLEQFVASLRANFDTGAAAFRLIDDAENCDARLRAIVDALPGYQQDSENWRRLPG